MLRTYDPKEVSFIYAGSIIEGYADGTFLSIERNEDSATYQRASQGGGTRTLSNDKSGRFTITLQQTSPSNSTFNTQVQAMELSGGGIASALLKDNSGSDLASGAKSWVVKPSNMEYGNDLSNREWILETDNLEIFPLGQLA